jgi:hypothetical protein
LESFFETLPPEFNFAVEFRDMSWMKNETLTLLRKHNVAYTIVDEPLLPPEAIVTSNIAYFRWHGSGQRPWYNFRYKEEELKPWIPKVKETAGKVGKLFGYFNNHFHGYAVENCLDVLNMLGALTPIQSKARSAVKNHLKASEESEAIKLDSFLGSKPLGLSDLLLVFMDSEKLKRAEQIEDDAVVIRVNNEAEIVASVREYQISIDIEKKRIQHDCADWDKVIPEKSLCKHLGKLMLTLRRERAIELLKDMDLERKDWVFEGSGSSG